MLDTASYTSQAMAQRQGNEKIIVVDVVGDHNCFCLVNVIWRNERCFIFGTKIILEGRFRVALKLCTSFIREKLLCKWRKRPLCGMLHVGNWNGADTNM